jgi:nitrogen regulation protein NR(I)
MAKLLVIDDEPNLLYSLEKSFRSEGLEVCTANTGKRGMELVAEAHPDAVILDVRLGDACGLDVFTRIRSLDPRLPVIIITAYATTEIAIEATKRGAFEYLLKPVDIHRLRDAVREAIRLRQLSQVPAIFEEGATADGNVDVIVGRSAAMQDVYKAIGRVAPLDVPVLITGESGTGKELVARAIYQHSKRASKPFLPINCAALPSTILESELFGHERGAFTGADRRRIGRFEQADGGTIFLDEIGDMEAGIQPKMLRLLQDQCFERLGGNETIRTDVRLIAATNRPLEDLVAGGRFRQDLFFRLNVFTIELPPLSARLDDIPVLIEHFLRIYNRAMGKNVRAVAPDAMHRLRTREWPGNVRELQSAVKYALVRASGEVIAAEALPEPTRAAASGAGFSEENGGDTSFDLLQFVNDKLRAGEGDIYQQTYEAVDRVILDAVLRHVRGNQVQASQLLGVSRNTLRNKLRNLGMAIEKQLL